MAGRALAFADPEIIRMATDEYLPVAGDDWYQRRREDPEGEFFRKVADQGPRKGAGGSTRQGIYCLTASGKLLAFRNSQDPQVMRETLREGLTEWGKLPATQRQPGAVRVPELPASQRDPRYHRQPPEGGLILRVFARALDRADNGAYCACTGGRRYGLATSHDHLWLTQSEWRSLVPRDARQAMDVPAAIRERILRFHLVDNTRGEPPHWQAGEIRAAEMSLVVEDSARDQLRLRLEGRALLATDEDLSRAARGYEVALLGYITYDVASDRITAFEVVAVGEHWGEGRYTGAARPGRAPLGIAMELAEGDKPADRVPPQGIRSVSDYLGAAE